jgi:adenosylmethionine-8-amino-7-oxononanoate aminotransferase
MAGIDIVPDAWPIANALYARGHFTRPIGQTIQLVPPLSSTRDDLAAFTSALTAVLDAQP